MKYIIGGIALVLTVVAFIAIVFALINRDPEPEQASEVAELTDIIDQDSEVVFTTYGKIVALEEFRAIRISVSDTTRTVEVLSGYDGNVIERVELANTGNAYAAFIEALDNAGYSDVREFLEEREDGYCPRGERFVLEAFIDNQQVQRTWTSSCRDERGTFGGNRTLVERLFEVQIPDYRDIARSVRL